MSFHPLHAAANRTAPVDHRQRPPWIIVDTETTSLGAHHARVTEFAAVTVTTAGVDRCWALHVEPADSAFARHAEAIVDLCNNHVLVAHHAAFDVRVLVSALRRVGFEWAPSHVLCTRQLARGILPGRKSYSLPALTSELGIEHWPKHSALGDALATAELFLHLHRVAGDPSVAEEDAPT